jgi:hypothetical protein
MMRDVTGPSPGRVLSVPPDFFFSYGKRKCSLPAIQKNVVASPIWHFFDFEQRRDGKAKPLTPSQRNLIKIHLQLASTSGTESEQEQIANISNLSSNTGG